MLKKHYHEVKENLAYGKPKKRPWWVRLTLSLATDPLFRLFHRLHVYYPRVDRALTWHAELWSFGVY